MRDSTTSWAKAGLRTGDRLLTIGGDSVRRFDDFRRALGRLHVGDASAPTVQVEIERQGQRMRLSVPVSGYRRARVRLVDAETVTSVERARREAWLNGRD